MRERNRVLTLALCLVLAVCLSATAARAETPWPVEALRGLPLIGDKNAAVGDVDDVLIGADGRIVALVVAAQATGQVADRLSVPWSEVTVEPEPLQVELKRSDDKAFVPYPGQPAGTFGGIRAYEVSALVGAPAKNVLGETLGKVAGIAADRSGKIVKVSIADGTGPTPLPWSFVEVRQEKEGYPTGHDVEPIVVIDRP